MFALFFITNLIFLYFLWFIKFKVGLYIIGFIILVLLIFSFFTSEGKKFWKAIFSLVFINYIGYVNLVFVLIGVYFILLYFLPAYTSVFYIDVLAVFICLFLLVIFGIIGILIGKPSWIKLTFFGIILIWLYLAYLNPSVKLFYYFVSFILSVSVFLNLFYFIKNGKNLKELEYTIFVSFIIALIIILAKFLNLSYIGIAILAQVIIGIILLVVNLAKIILNKLTAIAKLISEYKHELTLFGYSEIEISEGEKKFFDKYSKYYSFLSNIVAFFESSPFYIKVIFSLTNTIPLLVSTYYFFLHLGLHNNSISELLYRIGIILFFINFILFKKLNWFVLIQRFFSFLVLNIVIYFSIINFFGENYTYLCFGGILWNLFSTAIILFLGKKLSFEALDYLNWLLINLLAYFVNIYFLFKISLNNYLGWGILFLYTGIYIFLSRQVYLRL